MRAAGLEGFDRLLGYGFSGSSTVVTAKVAQDRWMLSKGVDHPADTPADEPDGVAPWNHFTPSFDSSIPELP